MTLQAAQVGPFLRSVIASGERLTFADVTDIEDAIAEARAPLDVERLREAVDAALFDAEMDDSHPGCRAKWRRVAMGAFDAATSA